jgi:energy-coupling factor transport system permease protein
VNYRRRPTPLHAARAAVGCVYCLAFAVAALCSNNPLVLGAVLAAVLAAGHAAGVGQALRRAVLLALPLVLAVVVVNALVSRNGLTVILRLGDLPLLGHTDVTLEATVYGAVLGLRAMVLILCGALYTVAIDPDEMLGLLRRVSFRSALTASVSTRLVPVLLRDSRALADARRCRPGPPPSRMALMRAAGSGVLDRALEVAAALEVRGYGAARRPPRRPRRPLSRHDIAFGCSAVALVALAVLARALGWASMQAYPTLRFGAAAPALTIAAAMVLVALGPFANRRGIGR